MDYREFFSAEEFDRPPESVVTFIKENVIETAEGRKCIDGRYTDEQGRGMIARPGGDFGYVMTLLALQNKYNYNEFPIKNPFDLVHGAVTQNGGKFYMHTDEHVGEGHIGCGHASHAANENTDVMYGVHSIQAKQALHRAAEFTRDKSESMVWENLKGDHKEEGLLVVNDTDKTLRSQGKDQRMFFVYDKARDEQYIQNMLIPFFVEQMGLDSTSRLKFQEAFFNVSNQQMNATLTLLAQGKPIYEVQKLGGEDTEIKKMHISARNFIDDQGDLTGIYATPFEQASV